MTVDEMYAQLTPENQQKVNAMIDKLIEEQGERHEDHTEARR